MNQFLVPQFIEVEPKIIGPITVRQFIMLVIALVLATIEYKLLRFWTFVIFTVATFGIFGTMAFLKINGRPFHYFLLNVIETLKKPMLKTWNKELTPEEIKKFLSHPQTKKMKEALPHKRLAASSHLEELALIVNTGGVYQPTNLDLEYEKSQKEKSTRH